jgi:hypothetical protein
LQQIMFNRIPAISYFFTGLGALNLRWPRGGCAKGIPQYISTGLPLDATFRTPSTGPLWVSTTALMSLLLAPLASINEVVVASRKRPPWLHMLLSFN